MTSAWFLSDKPGSPRDLAPAEVWSDNVLLRWEPPEDDGGYEISYYIIEMMNTKTGQWSKAGLWSCLLDASILSLVYVM